MTLLRSFFSCFTKITFSCCNTFYFLLHFFYFHFFYKKLLVVFFYFFLFAFTTSSCQHTVLLQLFSKQLKNMFTLFLKTRVAKMHSQLLLLSVHDMSKLSPQFICSLGILCHNRRPAINVVSTRQSKEGGVITQSAAL